MKSKYIFHQLFEKETSTYTYIFGDPITREAVIIDPVAEMIDRDLNLIQELKLKLKYVLDTHVHADHITGSGEIRRRTGAKVGLSSSYDLACPDLHLEDGQELSLGDYKIKVLHTPGHTSGCLTYQIGTMIFTGDALLIRGCGRTDFQEGSSDSLYQSVREKIFLLPDDTVIYPGHDYKGFTTSTVGIEKELNPRLKLEISKDQFVEIMANLKLAYPKKINEAVPANLQCGLPLASYVMSSEVIEGVPRLTAHDLYPKLGQFKIIDVRGMDEFNNDLGHIPNAELASLGTDLQNRLEHEKNERDIVFVCRSGKRSIEAAHIAMRKGLRKVYSLEGGMIHWNELRFPIEKDRGGS
jgi:glyoxylase-like metal-dependent hydrolase (beta-lactamase superfamily II)/rhodanese-related sulfurtransferase